MKIAKKKKTKHPSDKLSTSEVIKITNYLNLSAVLLTLWAVYGVQERVKAEEFVESYISFLEEKMEGRNTVNGIVLDCINMTGFNPIDIIDSVYEKKGLRWKK